MTKDRITQINSLEPPSHLSEKSQNLFREIVPRRARSPERVALLVVGLGALDRAEQAAAILTTSGMVSTTKTTGAVHVHPLVKVEREMRHLFAKVWDQLGLNFCPMLDGGRWPDK